MKRREFFGWVSVSAIASSFPIALAACSPQPTASLAPQTPSRADGFQPLGSLAALEQQGFIAAKLDAQSVLVIRNPAASSQLITVNTLCPHANCTVTWEKGQKAFVCPCHGSKFTSSGAVAQGPAKDALTTYVTKVEGDAILVKIA